MSLSQGGFTFGGVTLHGDLLPSEWELRDVRGNFFGVGGEVEIRGERGARDLLCHFTLSGFATAAAALIAFKTIEAQTNRLSGTLTVTGNLAAAYGNCTFKGAVRDRIVRDAATGTFLFRGVLRWRQLIPDS